MKHANISLFVPHIGCPHRCSFCNQYAITGNAKAPGPEEVAQAADIAAKSLGNQAGKAEIAFFGGSFTAIPREYMLSLLEAAEKAVKRYGFAGIRCSARPDAVGEKVLKLLKQHGVTAVELGAQSMDDGVLLLNRRGHTAAQTEEAARKIKGEGFELGLQMMTGLYGDTGAKALETAERLIGLQPDTVRVYPAVVLPNTYLAELYTRGEYSPQTLEEAVSLCARLLPRFEAAGIKVLRMGLHAERQVEEQKLAGPYHPAFRELVQGRVFLERLLPELRRRGAGACRIGVNPRFLSAALGQKRCHLEILRQAGFEADFFQDGSIPPGEWVIREKQRDAT